MAIASSENSSRLGPGAFVAIVGPSGAGKDSVIARARHLLRDDNRFVFPRRVVTRAPDLTEDNLTVTANDFDRLLAAGDLALDWGAHNLRYGVLRSVDRDIASGRVVVVNVSRTVVPRMRERYSRGAVVLIDAPAALRRLRLFRRGREVAGAIDVRLAREVERFNSADADLVIENSGELEDAARDLASFVSELAVARVVRA
jgi:ribose 1,5-bisphosphokinase